MKPLTATPTITLTTETIHCNYTTHWTQAKMQYHESKKKNSKRKTVE